MISKADAIVIGSGGLGAATAYYLSQREKLSVALIDKHDIGSQTSPRAAGMVSCARKSDLMISLIKDACRKIETFTEETGQPLDWVHSGSLKIARRPQDVDVIKADFERGRRMGLDVEIVSPEKATPPQSVLEADWRRSGDEDRRRQVFRAGAGCGRLCPSCRRPGRKLAAEDRRTRREHQRLRSCPGGRRFV